MKLGLFDVDGRVVGSADGDNDLDGGLLSCNEGLVEAVGRLEGCHRMCNSLRLDMKKLNEHEHIK